MRTGAARVYLCTCVPVYLISHRASDKFPLLRQAQHKVSIPRPRGDVSRTGMESPVLIYEVHADSRCPCLPVYVCTCLLDFSRASDRSPRFDSAFARRGVPHGDGIARAQIRSPCGLALSVFTCLPVYLCTCLLDFPPRVWQASPFRFRVRAARRPARGWNRPC